MVWLHRFWLGLPCRPTDIAYINEHFRELSDTEFNAELRFMWPVWWFDDEPEAFLSAIRRWVANGHAIATEAKPATNVHRPAGLDIVDFVECPASDCPLRAVATPVSGEKDTAEEDAEVPIHLGLILGGFSKKPKQAFLNLVKKHHAKSPGVKEVIITDPYLLADVGETGESGGYGNVVDYLKALRLTEKDEFDLLTNPRKTQKSESKSIFDRVIKTAFPKVRIDFYKSIYRFHDRLYLVRDLSGIITGVFGPSLNGLTSNSIVLMGKIDETAAMETLRKMFE